jgi:hypothetical protein
VGQRQVAYGVRGVAVAVARWPSSRTSRNPALSLDAFGSVLALVGLFGLVLGIVEGPERGGPRRLTVTALVVGVTGWRPSSAGRRPSHDPMLDVGCSATPAGGGQHPGVPAVLRAFGFFYLRPQFCSSCRVTTRSGPRCGCCRWRSGSGRPAALGPKLLERFGSRWVGRYGMGQMAAAFALFALLGDGPYWRFAVTLVVFGFGFGLAITPATQLIIDGLPADRRTLSAAVNDVTREVGGALGGAVAASVLVAVYGARLTTTGLPEPAAEAAEDGIASALGVAGQLGPDGAALVASASDAFTSGYSASLLVGAGVLLLGAVVGGLLAPREESRETVGAGAGTPADGVPA